MLASLPMYDFPEIEPATDGFWAALARELGVSFALTRQADWTGPWHSPDLLFSQTCGYPFTHTFKGKLTYVATPHYAADGCEGPYYRSILFARDQRPLRDFKGTTAAFNSADSMSGMLALKSAVVEHAHQGKFFGRAVETGGHVASLRAVQSGRADLCAIDCVTVALLRRYRPSALEGMIEVGRTLRAPGLPFVTRKGSARHLQAALSKVTQDSAYRDICDALLLTGITILKPSDYDAITGLEAAIVAKGDVRLTTDS